MTDPIDSQGNAPLSGAPPEPTTLPGPPPAPSAPPTAAAPTTPEPAVTPPNTTTTRRRPRARSLLAGLLLVLGSLSLVLSGVTVWAHQVLLNTDRYTAIVATVSDDPAVITAVSSRLAETAVTALDIQGRLESVLPERAAIIAAPVTDQIEERLEQVAAEALASAQFQTFWVDANRFLHEKVVAFLRGDTTVLQTRDGVVYLDVYPLVDAVLRQLQTMGIIPADAQLPDVTSFELGTAGRALLERSLGVTLPEDFAAIPIFESARLERLQSVVQAFDVITIGTVLLTAVLLLGAIILARHRRRMVMAVGLGAVAGLMLLSIVIRLARTAVIDAMATPEGAAAVGAIFAAGIDDLRGLLLWVAVIGAIVALVAYLVGRPSWFELASTDHRTGWAAEHLSGIRGVLVALVVFLLIGFIVDWPLAIFLAAVAGLIELGLRNLREPVEA